ncbi:MAG: lipopolysaccharide biosynthesis protein [Candidatus Krumholzibacteriia bacterium]
MNAPLAPQIGSAMFWRALQLGGARGILLVRTLILARLLVPGDFGLLAIAVVAVDFLIAITDLGMVPALVQRPGADRRHYDAAWTVGVLRALLIAAVVFAAAPGIAALFAEPRAADLIRVLALRPLIESAASIRIAELTRGLRFRAIAFIRLPDAVVNTAVAIALANTFGVWALVIGTLAGQVAFLAMSYILAPYRPRLSFDRAAAGSLIRFGRWIFLTGLIAIAGSSVLQIVISRRLGAVELGLYFLAARLAHLPLEVSTEVVGAVAFPLYASLQEDLRQAERAFRSLLAGMAALLVPVCAVLIALAPSLVENVLGDRWLGTAPLIRLLALTTVIGLLGESVVPIFKGLGQPARIMVLEIIQSTVLVTLAWFMAGAHGITGAVLAWVPAAGLAQIMSVVYIRRTFPRPFAGLGGPLGSIVLVSLGGAAVALAVDTRLPGLGGFLVAGVAAATVMAAALWYLDRRFRFGLAADLVRAFPQLAGLARWTSPRPR